MSSRKLIMLSSHDMPKNFQSVERTKTIEGTIPSGGTAAFSVVLTNDRALNVSYLFIKKSSDSKWIDGYVASGTGYIRIDVTGGSSATDYPLETWIDTTDGQTTAEMRMYNTDPNTVTIVATDVDLRFILYTSPF